MRRLTVVPTGGLCNRLRVVLSALALARSDRGVQVRVEWARNRECRAAFTDLFLPVAEDNFRIAPRRLRHIPDSRRLLHLPARLRSLFYSAQRQDFHADRDAPVGTLLAKDGARVYISTCYEIFPVAQLADVRELSLRPELQQRVDCLAECFSGDTVGVHIRRRDNAVSIRTSPTEAFVEAMQREVEANSAASFFLATDDKAVKESLQAKFPGRVFIQDTALLHRNTLAGMQEAVVDLYCLARTRKILGSYWSSFSGTAAEIGGIPLQTIGTDAETTPTESMRQLVFATNNAHKLSEIRAIIGDRVRVLSLADIGCEEDIPETADTLEGNARQKARYISDRYGLDCFADDTGLEVRALDGRPGVHTARYACPDRNDTEANTAKLLAEMEKKTDRHARFRTVIALIEKGEEHLFEGIVEGEIAPEKRGERGFGYDPVFIPEATGRTFAELGVEVKNTISHRARAVCKLAEYLNA